MKNIAIVIRNLSGGGGERVAANIASELTKYGANCHIFTFDSIREISVESEIPIHTFPHDIERLHIPGISILPKSFRKKIIANRIDRFILEKMDNRVDLALSNLMKSDKLMAFSSLNTYLIIHCTISQELASKGASQKKLNRKKKKLESIYLRKRCIAVSKGIEQDFKTFFGKKSNISTIYNPINLDKLQEQANSPLKDIPSSFFLHMGRFEQVKRHDLLLKAYALSQVTTPLLLLGKGSLEESVKQLAVELNIEHLVHFVGFKKNPYPYLKQAKCFILSSDNEGLPTVLLESLALNTPAISTDCPSGPNEILPPQNLCPVNDFESLAKLIQEADSNPNQFKQSLPKKFSPKYATAQYLSLCSTKPK